MKNKEQVFDDFIQMIVNSWTYNKMTTSEKENCIDTLTSNQTKNDIKGNYNQRWSALNVVYSAFLSGIGYDGFSWRDDDEL